MTYDELVDVILPTPDGLGCEFRAWKPNKYHTDPCTHIVIEKRTGVWVPFAEGTEAEMKVIVDDFAQLKLHNPEIYEELIIVPYPKEF